MLKSRVETGWNYKSEAMMNEIESLVDAEIEKIQDSLILKALKSTLVEPRLRYMKWEYSTQEQKYPCWIVAEDKQFDTQLVYSTQAFGPKCPWGLVGISNDSMGDDSGWFTNLEDAFVESFMANELAIWDLAYVDDNNQQHILASSVTYDEAYSRVAKGNERNYRIKRRAPPLPSK